LMRVYQSLQKDLVLPPPLLFFHMRYFGFRMRPQLLATTHSNILVRIWKSSR
jgi:hypothetical protein